VSRVGGHPDCDVLICGLGPTGIALALLLVRRGITVVAVERSMDLHPWLLLGSGVVRLGLVKGADQVWSTRRSGSR